jgi:dihydroorotate dehydrogenase (NAD+) catalytic subunit
MPLIASGGVRTSSDAVEALVAGASAVQVGTATLLDPVAPVTIAQGIVTELQRRGLTSPSQLRTVMGRPAAPATEGSPR